MRYRVLCFFILLPLGAGSVEGQDSTCQCQAKLVREADSVRVAYRDSVLRSQAELAREADSVRAAYYRTNFTTE